MSDPCHILSHARGSLIEQIMALIGRSSPDPVRYRRLLEGSDTETLQRKWQALMDSETHSASLRLCGEPLEIDA